MLLYDTMSRRKLPFVPASDPVAIYVCGITPYDTTHLGHAFTYVFFDVLIRYLRFRGHRTRYVQNVTDVDDDILRKAREVGTTWDKLAAEQTALYQQDMAALNVLPPDVFPRASQEIPKIVEISRVLLDRGVAYRSDGNLYFDVDRDQAYGKLSHLERSDMLPIANQRGNYPDDPLKRDPLDFVLWQRSAPGEPRWDSPWGPGRPGWHIECSAMSLRYLGDTIDIHGGGSDLVFPHHESEIAQSESFTSRQPFVRYWVHTAMVYLGGQKMSKSLGNLIMVRDLLARHSPDAIRLLLLAHGHLEPWGYDEREMEEANVLSRLLNRAATGPVPATRVTLEDTEEGREILGAMDDDLDTPRVVGILRRLAEQLAGDRLSDAKASLARATLWQVAPVLGLTLA